jgi:hypothetical protein
MRSPPDAVQVVAAAQEKIFAINHRARTGTFRQPIAMDFDVIFRGLQYERLALIVPDE